MAAVDASAVASVLGIATTYKNLSGGVTLLPQRIAVIGQGASASSYSTTKQAVTSSAQVGAAVGYGSPLHLAVRQLLPENGDGVGTIPVTIYPLEDHAASGVAASGDITPGGTQLVDDSYIIRINNINSQAFVIAASSTVADIITSITAAINAVLEMPVIATDATPGTSTTCDIESKWKGVSSNDIFVEIVGSTTGGTTWIITQPVGGLVNPDTDTATDQIGNVWETMILNCMEQGDEATLTKLAVVGEGRWGSLVHKPFVSFVGMAPASVAAAIAIPETRKTDRTNSQLVSPASNDLPMVIAARQLARIAKLANNDPAHDYVMQDATGLVPGVDSSQWDYLQQDQAVKGGSSTVTIIDGVVNLGDTITFYHPTGETIPAYRKVVTIVKLQNVIFNLNLIFATSEWAGAPLVRDEDVVTNASAKKPAMAKSAIAKMVNALARLAILVRADETIASMTVEIDSQNPDRLNIVVPVFLSGNTNIKSIDLEFSFNFGTAQVIA